MGIPRFCLAPRCPNSVEGRDSYCPKHAPEKKPWAVKRNTGQVSSMWRRQRRRALVRDRHRCAVCGDPAVEVDHIIPRSAGGTDDLDNLRAVCRPCHRVKSEAERVDGLRKKRSR
jgi:5-methylcytosine-specific restriction protein A